MQYSAESFDELDKALMRTFAYASVFGCTPSFRVLRRWLISDTFFSESALQQRWSFWSQKLGFDSNKNCCKKEQLRPVWKSVFSALDWLQMLPWVQAVWITGSVAAENISENDDIDFLVLTAPKRLWITRLFVLGISFVTGHWRYRNEITGPRTRNAWCWNIWIEPSVGQDSIPNSLYTAREIAQARLVFIRRGVPRHFLLNLAPWLKTQTYRGEVWARKQAHRVIPSQEAPRQWFSFFFDGINSVSYSVQQWYMQEHQTHEKVLFDQAWFHPNDLPSFVQKKYEKMQQYWSVRMQLAKNFTPPNDWNTDELSLLTEISSLAQEVRSRGRSVVLVTGVFDLLHEEHISFLQASAQEGNVLLVGVESDVRVRQLKGEGRPVQSQEERVEAVSAVSGVTKAFILPSEFSRPEHHRALLSFTQPSILAVSSHTPHQEKKAALMQEFGGEIRVVKQQNPLVSTTLKITRTIEAE